MMCARPVALG